MRRVTTNLLLTGSALLLVLSLTTSGSLGSSRPLRSDGVDLITTLLGDVPTNLSCCCSLTGVATHFTLTGAQQDGLALKGVGDDLDVYVRLAPRAYVYVGLAQKAVDGNFYLNAAALRTALILVPKDNSRYSWVTTLDGEVSGSGRMKPD